MSSDGRSKGGSNAASSQERDDLGRFAGKPDGEKAESTLRKEHGSTGLPDREGKSVGGKHAVEGMERDEQGRFIGKKGSE